MSRERRPGPPGKRAPGPRSGGPGGDRPSSGGFRSDRGPPRGDRPRPEGRRFEGDRSSGERSGGFRTDRPRGDRPREDRPWGGPRENRESGDGRSDRGPRSGGGWRSPGHNKDSPFRGMHSGPKSAQAPAPSRPHLTEDELRYLGKNACLALWKARPDDLIRVYVKRELADQYSELIEFCAKNRKSYHLVGDNDLEKLTDSVHHQGICIVAKTRRPYSEDYFFRQVGNGRNLVIFLDGVGNPHNLGAILRTAAHFGVKYVAVWREELVKLSAAIYRTAEGAAEYVNLVQVEDSEKFLDRLHGLGFSSYAFEASGTQSLFETRLNEKSVMVFGAEVEGLSGLVRSIVATKVSIPGTGAVESLNVSVVAALAMGEFAKQASARTVRIVKNKP